MLVYIEDKICKFADGNLVSTAVNEDSCIIVVKLPFYSDIFLLSEIGFDVSLKKPGVIGIYVRKDNDRRASISIGLGDGVYLLDYPTLYISFSATGKEIVLALVPMKNINYECYDTEELMMMGE